MKKTLLALLLVLTLLPLSGCGDWAEPEQDDVFQTLQEYYGQENTGHKPAPLTSFSLPYFIDETVDPISCSEGPHEVLGALLYEGLFALDHQFVPQLSLAESYTYDPDSYTYTILLREGITFSDGSVMDGYDVAATLQRARSSPRYAARLRDVVSIYSYGNTVEIGLWCDNAQLPALLDIPIVKAGTEDRLFPLGSGPYYYSDGDGAPHLAASENWWQKEKVPVSEIKLKRCKDNDSVAYAFYAREVQLLVYDLTATHVSNVYSNGTYTDAPSTTMQYVGINLYRAPLNDPKLRSALNLGIARGDCVSAYLLGHGAAAQFPLNPAAALYPGAREVLYSPDHFDTAMEAAGYSTGKQIPLTMLVNAENEFRIDAARQIASDLSRHDLKIEVEVLPWDQYLLALQQGNFDLYYGECRMTADWDLRPLVSPGGSLNYCGYSDPRFNQLIVAALSADEEGREAASDTLYEYFAQQAPFLPVCFKSLSVLTPSDAIDRITPTAANPFYDISLWKLHLDK